MLTTASILAVFELHKATNPDGTVIEPKGDYEESMIWYVKHDMF
jgi:hypothetical protein